MEGPTKTMTRIVPLGTRTARFDEKEIDMAQLLTLEMAVTQGNCVVSDILETEFLSGMFRPDLSSPFFWDSNMMYKENNNQPVGTFYFLGFGHNLDNWYVDVEETPRFWVGLRHGLAQPYEGEFLHYRLQVTDGNGDDILGFNPETVTTPDYENTILALGDWADTDVQPENMVEFANIRRSNYPNTPTPAAHETVSPVKHYWENKAAGLFPQIFQSGSVNTAYDQRLSFAVLADVGTRGLYAHSPDHIYNLPVDTFDLDDRFTIAAWAENVAGQRISDFAFITFKVREVLTPDNVYSNLQPLAIRQQRPPREESTEIKSRSYGTDLRAVEEAAVVNLLTLDQSPTAKSKTGHNWHSETKSDDNNGGNKNGGEEFALAGADDGDDNESDSDPVFLISTRISVKENSISVPTTTAEDTDSQDSIESIVFDGGADASLFNFSTGGHLSFINVPDSENPGDSDGDNEYQLDIKVTSGTGDRERTVTQSFIVEVSDESEVAGEPQSLTASSATTTITLTWQAADNTGPALDGYQVQYLEESSSTFLDAETTDGEVLTATVSNLDPSTTYVLQVRAISAEGDSDYVQITQDTLADPNANPVLQAVIQASTRLSVDEHTSSVGTITAQDSESQDNIESFDINGGADASLFTINNNGDLSFINAPDYEDPADSDKDNEYLVDIEVTSGTGDRAKTAVQSFFVNVEDVTGVPGEPKLLTATAATSTTITLSWQAGDNEGPALIGYDVQYLEGTTGTFQHATSTAADVLTATISNLDAETTYTLGVRARSAEGESGYVQITQATAEELLNADPVLQATTGLSVVENSTSVGTITAQDGDSQDNIESFELDSGADAVLFEIGLDTGALVFKAGPDYENPADCDKDNEYLVDIEVTSGTGDRAKSVTASFTVEVTDAEGPGEPQFLTVTGTSTTTVTLTWQAIPPTEQTTRARP